MKPEKKTVLDAIKVLQDHNAWRQGEGLYHHDVKEITKAIDKATEIMEEYLTIIKLIPEIYNSMAYLFDGGEFPYWLNQQKVPLGAMKEYHEAKECFDEYIKIRIVM